MSAVHVPSVPRGMLLPSLDTHLLLDEEEPVDPTPPGSHWLFRPLPFTSWADLHSETVTIRNPSVFRAASLTGYTLSDLQRRHTYAFPDGYSIPARSSITLHCCPGGKLSDRELAALPRTALLWKNQDGSLRRKEVLNDDGDAVILYNDSGKEIAAIQLPGLNDDASGSGNVDGPTTAYMRLPGVKHAQVLALRTLVLTLCYVRLVSILISASFVTVHPDVFVLLTFLAHLLDVLCRWASSQPGAPMDEFGVVLATLGDRLSVLVLLGSLVVLGNNQQQSRIFGGILALDIAANWLQLSVASAVGGSRPLAGVLFIKETGTFPDFTTHLMVHYPTLLTMVSLGNEAYLLWCYLLASASLPHGLRPIVLRGVCFVASWFHAFDESLFCDGLGEGPGVDSFVVNGNLGLEKADGFPMAWRAVWWMLKMCCAGRQFLSCIQALISISTLSSGVIADATGQDLQRRRSTGVRGRPLARANGVGSGGGMSRARSRSRAR